jgi:uncharacterized membrane protein
MRRLGIRRYLTTGILLLLPIWLTWIVLRFLFNLLSSVTAPLLRAVGWPDTLDWLLVIVGALVTLVLIYLLGWLGSMVVGARLLGAFDRLMERVPLVKSIYGGTKKLLNVIQGSPGQAQRVVLVGFPHQGMKAVALVTRTLTDTVTGEQYAAVYVPTTPNPTSGFLQLVPVADVHPSDMSIDEAMSFIISGGAINPQRFAPAEQTPDGEAAAEQTPDGEAAAEQTPDGEAAAEQTPDGEAPGGKASPRPPVNPQRPGR